MVREKTRLAIYDMDRTVTVRGTYTPFLLFAARRTRPWRLLLAPLAVGAMAGYTMKLVSRKRLKEINLSLLLGPRLSAAALAPHIEAYADHVMAHNLFGKAVERIAADRAAGYRVALCTASYELYVDAIARRIGIAPEDVIGTRLVREGDMVLARIDGENCYDRDKLPRIAGWMEAIGVARDDAHIRCYSDHVSDVPMLDLADEAFATTPSPKLRAEAARRGWPVLDFSG